ncbi:AmiA-like protein [Posidoniimonas corsicana]|uniref:AmiA-like protein n=1 Tax=Posidoniimonas corsicana TaxID=1938618 RepID=A0A5C5VFQ5_9BACT|nr:N-acetylmuramoyl-L-alanine amidase [Posidoniimonas corsicana]TWT37436.1 AmiA-like protein [Posidoniimonas corsicana]
MKMHQLRTILLVTAVLAASVCPAQDDEPVVSLGPVAVGGRPTGALSGKIVYVHGGHGYTANNDRDGSWTTQRPLLLGMVEDLGNKDQMDFFVDHIFRAGATVVPLRPVGDQPLEVVMDNTDPGVTFKGDWRTGLGGVYFGQADAEPYRFAHTTAAETATAEYRPNLPKAGVWPVYAWATAGGNRAADQTYAVHHAGGVSEVSVDHRRVGHGLVYLGSYYFNAGTDGAVVIGNASREPGSVVIADMIRFGNGRGDTDRGGGVSGQDRETESGLYWIAWHVARSQGIETDSYRQIRADQSATVSAPPRYSKFMNNEAEGPAEDRVFVSFHSNAGSGKNRGVLGLYNGNNYATSRTPHQLLLAETLAREINENLIAQPGVFEHDWYDRGKVVTLDRADIEFGELNNKYIDNEFDATIIETGFHDNEQDSQMLRDPRVRDAIAKAACEGLIKYFHEIDGGRTPVVAPPAAVTHLRATAPRDGVVTLAWNAPKSGAASGGRPAGYVVYTSTDGRSFDSGRRVPGGATSTYSVAGLDAKRPCFFRVASYNAGGVSTPSEALPCTPRSQGQRVLVVDGFDRWDRHMNATQPHYQGGQADRVRTRVDNPRLAAAVTTTAICDANANVIVEGAANEAVAGGLVSLNDYDAVFWVLGEESSHDRTFDDREQQLAAAYLSGGGKLFVSGADLAWDLDNLNHGRDFCRGVLRMEFVADSPAASDASGATGSALDGVHVVLPQDAVSAAAPDAVRAAGGGRAALTFGGSKLAAAVQHADGQQRVVAMTIPLELIPDPAARSQIAAAALRFFELGD